MLILLFLLNLLNILSLLYLLHFLDFIVYSLYLLRWLFDYPTLVLILVFFIVFFHQNISTNEIMTTNCFPICTHFSFILYFHLYRMFQKLIVCFLSQSFEFLNFDVSQQNVDHVYDIRILLLLQSCVIKLFLTHLQLLIPRK